MSRDISSAYERAAQDADYWRDCYKETQAQLADAESFIKQLQFDEKVHLQDYQGKLAEKDKLLREAVGLLKQLTEAHEYAADEFERMEWDLNAFLSRPEIKALGGGE